MISRIFERSPSAPTSALPLWRAPSRVIASTPDAVSSKPATCWLVSSVTFGAARQPSLEIGAMDHRVRIAEALAKRLVDRDRGDFLARERVHHHQAVDEDRVALEMLAQPEPIEHVERVGTELDAGPDLAEGWCLLEHARRKAAFGERQRRRQSADAAADYEDGIVLLRHGTPHGPNHAQRIVVRLLRSRNPLGRSSRGPSEARQPGTHDSAAI